MNNRDPVANFRSQVPTPIDRDVLADLLERAEIIRQEDTCISGWIRVLSINDAILVQEETPDGDALARRMPSIADAEAFVNDRLATYERMWDGCGCKIDYLK